MQQLHEWTKEDWLKTRYKEGSFYDECGDTQEQIVQKGDKCPSLKTLKVKTGLRNLTENLVKMPQQMLGGLNSMTFKGSFQFNTILWFFNSDSTILFTYVDKCHRRGDRACDWHHLITFTLICKIINICWMLQRLLPINLHNDKYEDDE